MLPWIDLEGLLNTAIEQIRVHATTDAAVSLRLLRLLHDVAVTVEHDAIRQSMFERGKRVVEGCRGRMPFEDLARVEQRLATLEWLCVGSGRGSPVRRKLSVLLSREPQRAACSAACKSFACKRHILRSFPLHRC
jgi:hypothetical protein